jgi:hypothetical protein
MSCVLAGPRRPLESDHYGPAATRHVGHSARAVGGNHRLDGPDGLGGQLSGRDCLGDAVSYRSSDRGAQLDRGGDQPVDEFDLADMKCRRNAAPTAGLSSRLRTSYKTGAAALGASTAGGKLCRMK